MAEVNTLTTKIELEANARGTAQVEKLGKALESVTGSTETLEKALSSAGASGEKASRGVGEVGKEASKAGKEAEKGASKFGVFFKQLKRIATYRLIRSSLKAIVSGFKEGIANLYQWSLLNDTKFAESMDSLATSILYIKNVMGTALAPIIQDIVVPAIYAISEAVADAVNWLNQLIAILKGESTYTRAIRKQTEYAKATGGAAKELRRMLLGFDEINRLEAPNGGGGGSAIDYDGMFEKVDVELELDEWTGAFKKLKREIQPIIDDIGTMVLGLKQIIHGALGGDWEETFRGFSTFFEGVRSLISDTTTIAANLISGLLDKIKVDVPAFFDQMIISVTSFFDNAIAKVGSFFDWVKEKTGIDTGIISGIVEGAMGLVKTIVVSALENIKTELPRIIDDIKLIIGGIATFVSGVFSGDWQSAWDGVVKIASGAFDLIKAIAEGVINTVIATMNWAIAQINSIHVSFPNWDILGSLAGKTWSPNIKSIGAFSWGGNKQETTTPMNWRDSSTKYQQDKKLKEGVSAISRADGGYVNAGSLFIAGEAGAEFVGNINGKTGVMNTDQFGAVMQPTTMAIYEIGSAIVGAVNNIPVPSVKIGDRDIYRASERGKRLTGSSLVQGAR